MGCVYNYDKWSTYKGAVATRVGYKKDGGRQLERYGVLAPWWGTRYINVRVNMIDKILDYVPFFCLATGHTPTPFTVRMVEAAIIGAVAMFGTVSVLGERIDGLARTQIEIKAQITKIRDDVYIPITRRGEDGLKN